MFHYLYTNDMRIDSLREKAISFAHMFLTDNLPSSEEDKSLNNNGLTIGYYLNLKAKGNSAKLVANGKFRIVILNFIKKFQYPNPRTKESFKNVINDEINLAPLREIIKLLFVAKLSGYNDFYLTKSELEHFIFFNKNVAKSVDGNFDRYSLLLDILSFKENDILPKYIAGNDERIWKHKDRQLNELISILRWSGFVYYEHDKIYLKEDSELSSELKSELYDILNFNEYWDYSELINEEKLEILQKSYFDYIDYGLDLYFTNTLNSIQYTVSNSENVSLPKPFLLLAGVSGTGKSRFVREQVPEEERKERYQLVAVRPDWHEPSDLLGYVSRLSGQAQYVMTDVLKFIVNAWKAVANAGLLRNNEVAGSKAHLEQIPPYWLCLDEMNLAPVEQYFADYLAVIESRKWVWRNDNEFSYQTEALLSPTAWEDIANFKEQLDVDDELWDFFQTNGIGIPFNLIVAGTVNMDETTHAFSRKVLDRALSFDFSEFYPNDFDVFFEPKTQQKQLSYPVYSQITQNDFDKLEHAKKSIAFLTALNKQFENTPFKLGYRALNELLLSVKSFQPQTNEDLQAVWDDFVMLKVLPRIEGDENKLYSATQEGRSVLDAIETVLAEHLSDIWQDGDAVRVDFWQTDAQGEPLKTKCRTKPKLANMKAQLTNRGMVSFW